MNHESPTATVTSDISNFAGGIGIGIYHHPQYRGLLS